jgi:hypothetical protein
MVPSKYFAFGEEWEVTFYKDVILVKNLAVPPVEGLDPKFVIIRFNLGDKPKRHSATKTVSKRT